MFILFVKKSESEPLLKGCETSFNICFLYAIFYVNFHSDVISSIGPTSQTLTEIIKVYISNRKYISVSQTVYA